ncbi:MAG: CocE/NonD family hydrolase [Phaeodactylibacter sp.]|nr:CocE/NonD family hydrolase [Phaeodactylibacter sp.]
MRLYQLKHKLLSMLLLLPFLLLAQDITGEWQGILDIPGSPLRLVLHVESANDGYVATLDSPDQGAFGLEVPQFRFDPPQVFFADPKLGLQYNGQANGDFTEIRGTFTQGSLNLPLLLGREKAEPQDKALDYLQEHYTKKELYITMRDGIRLYTAVVTPKDTTQDYPILMIRTPYSIGPYGEGKFPFFMRIYQHLVREGYIFVFQDVRGKYMSEGEYVNVRPYNPKKKGKEIDESSDTYDSMDWLIKNVARNNGRIGIFGISYPGFYATMSIPDAHPALKAVSPQAPVTDWFIGDDFHHNGAFFVMDAFSFYSSFGKPRPKPTTDGPSGFDWPMDDNYEFFLDAGPIKNLNERYLGDSIAFWKDLMSHPNYDDFWKARNPRPHLNNVRPAVMTVGGFFDAEDSFGPLAVYKAIEKQNPASTENRIVMGPWYHGQWAAGDGERMGNIFWGFNSTDHYRELESKFFNYYLKGKGEMDIPEASIFDTGAGEWREFETWPPQNVTERKLYFQPAGGLAFEAPKARGSYDEYVSDPMKPVPYTEDVHLRRTREYMTDDQRFAARRPDVMVYETPVLEEDVTLTGPLTANLFVSTTGTDADYVVKLIDVFPDEMEDYPRNEKQVPMGGYQMLVRGEVFRGRFRNSFERPEPFAPGKVTQVRFETPDVAHTFKKGHRIMVQVQNSWFPLVDRNPQNFVDIYHCEKQDFQKATQRIYHDGEFPSYLEVKVLGQ